MVETMQKRGDVWFARLDEIAAHVRKVTTEGRYQPRRIRLPYYEQGLSESEFPKRPG